MTQDLNPVRLDPGTKSDSVPHSPASWHQRGQASEQLSLSTTLRTLALSGASRLLICVSLEENSFIL